MVDNERSLQSSPEIGYNVILLVYYSQGGLFDISSRVAWAGSRALKK